MRKIVLIALSALVLAACTVQPIYRVEQAPVNRGNATPADVKAAIQRAGAALGWEMRVVKDGLITGRLALRGHLAVVDITYDAKQYSIVYKDSNNLNYDGNNIHRNYNGWIQNLDKGIRAQLSL